MPKQKFRWWIIILSVLIAELTGILSSFLAGDLKSYYANLILPPFSPPGWLFGVVWTILFLLMGIASGIIFEIKQKKSNALRKTALTFYLIQLVINFLWSIIYFRFEWQIVSIITILVLDVLVIVTTKLFFRLNKSAGWMLIPYIIWLMVATYLTIGTVILN